MLINEDDIRRDPEEKYLALMDKQGIKLTGELVENITQTDTEIKNDCIVRIFSDGSREEVKFKRDKEDE